MTEQGEQPNMQCGEGKDYRKHPKYYANNHEGHWKAYSSNAKANGQATDRMAHQSPRDTRTIIISEVPSGRTLWC